MQPHMIYDVAWEKSEEIADTWFYMHFCDPDIARSVGDFLLKHHGPDDPVKFSLLGRGAFNLALCMTYKTGVAATIRFLLPGAAMFPEEKLRNEVANMRYIHDNTSIPVPSIFHWGLKKDSPLEIGPFIIMEYIEHDASMGDFLNNPELLPQERARLNPNIEEGTLQALYGELAGVLLQLSKPSLSRIGSISQLDGLTEEEKDEMEILVAKKVKEMESRVLAWDPDEYTLAHIDIAKTYAAKQAKKAEESKEEAEKVNPKSEDNEVEVDLIEANPDEPDVEQIAVKLTELSA